MKNRIKTQIALPLFIALSAACSTQALAQQQNQGQTVTFGGQSNTGPVSSLIKLVNIKITETAELNSSAFGNIMTTGLADPKTPATTTSLNNTTLTSTTQNNSGVVKADVQITGASTEFKDLKVNATAGGNLFSGTFNGTGTGNSVTLPSQTNSGAITAFVDWQLDPTVKATLNSTAFGNGQFLTFK